ncbi:MAG: hypothetical protein KDA42_12450 [Planctomycetales bacterium]|nr:hypothetical protein [Planctomycetales bacterium]
MKKLLLTAAAIATLAATGCHHCGLGLFGRRAFAPCAPMPPVMSDGCNSCNTCGESPAYDQTYADPGYAQPGEIIPGPVVTQ